VLAINQFAQGRPRVGRRHRIAMMLQIFRHRVADIRFVIADNYMCERRQIDHPGN